MELIALIIPAYLFYSVRQELLGRKQVRVCRKLRIFQHGRKEENYDL